MGHIFPCSAILVCVSVVSSLVSGLIWPWNISSSFAGTLSFSVTKGANGADGAGFFSALIKSVASWVAASSQEITGIVVFSGKNSAVYVMRSALVLKI